MIEKRKRGKKVQEEEEEDIEEEEEDEEDEEEEVPKKRSKKAKKGTKKNLSAIDELIEKLSDTKVILGIVVVIGFIMYNRSKQQEMQMLLKMKELEI